MLSAIYASEGTDAVITLDDSDATEVAVRALYMAGGAELTQSGVGVGTVRMSASVRRAELTEKGVALLALLKGATITLNSETWTIKSWIPFPGPHGEATGEVRLVLTS